MKNDGKDEAIMMRRHNRQFMVQSPPAPLGLQVALDTIGAFGGRPEMPRREMPRRGEI